MHLRLVSFSFYYLTRLGFRLMCDNFAVNAMAIVGDVSSHAMEEISCRYRSDNYNLEDSHRYLLHRKHLRPQSWSTL